MDECWLITCDRLYHVKTLTIGKMVYENIGQQEREYTSKRGITVLCNITACHHLDIGFD